MSSPPAFHPFAGYIGCLFNISCGLSPDWEKLLIDQCCPTISALLSLPIVTEIPGIIRICKTIKIDSITNASIKVSLWNCLTGPQTIEKAKQASLVAMDLRKKIDGHWGKEDVDQNNKLMTFIHVLCEFSHWEEKSRNVIKTCIDHNLVVPDEILIYAFKRFEDHFGTDNMLSYTIIMNIFKINQIKSLHLSIHILFKAKFFQNILYNLIFVFSIAI